MGTNIVNIRNYMETWNKYTYSQGLNYCYNVKKNKQLFNLCKNVMDMQQLSSKHMNGDSIEKLPIKDEGFLNIIFSDLFYKEVNNFITPVKYIADIVIDCQLHNITDVRKIAGIVGRGLRAFPSFVREMDLAYKLSILLPNADCRRTNSEEDVNDHTDILILCNNEVYRVWSYQSSERGLDNTARRVLGYRGVLKSGKHILCPFSIKNDKEKQNGWFFYTNEYIKNVGNIVYQNQYILYRYITSLHINDVKKYLCNIGMFLK